MPLSTLRQRSFTLIELLVVVSIIAILASLLLPALTAAREKAQSTQCINKLKQWGLAVAQYKDDNDGYYPGYSNTASQGSTSGSTMWYALWEPYGIQHAAVVYGPRWKKTDSDGAQYRAKVANGIVCPTRVRDVDWTTTGFSDQYVYALNWWVCYTGWRKDVPSPADTVLFGDSSSTRSYTLTSRPLMAVHGNKINFLFCDGHVESLPINDVPLANNVIPFYDPE